MCIRNQIHHPCTSLEIGERNNRNMLSTQPLKTCCSGQPSAWRVRTFGVMYSCGGNWVCRYNTPSMNVSPCHDGRTNSPIQITRRTHSRQKFTTSTMSNTRTQFESRAVPNPTRHYQMKQISVPTLPLTHARCVYWGETQALGRESVAATQRGQALTKSVLGSLLQGIGWIFSPRVAPVIRQTCSAVKSSSQNMYLANWKVR